MGTKWKFSKTEYLRMLPVLMGIDGPELSLRELELIRDVQPVGFVLFSRNIESVEQTRGLTESLRKVSHHMPIIAIDQEGGRVVRTSALGLNLPSARSMAKMGDPGLIATMAKLTAESLRYLGVNLNFAPILDICHDESVKNALPGRCWGNNASDVISHAGVFNRNMCRAFVPGCGKHFPGMGRACVDPHHDLPVIDSGVDELLRSDFIPFSSLAPELACIMTAHILLPSVDPILPSSLSPAITQQFLRNQMGYGGVVITDDLCMGAISERYGVAQAAVMAIRATCDLPLICHEAVDKVREFSSLLAQANIPEIIYDSEIRIERLLRKLAFPLRVNPAYWAKLLTKADDLCRRADHLNSNEESSPDSPVQFM